MMEYASQKGLCRKYKPRLGERSPPIPSILCQQPWTCLMAPFSLGSERVYQTKRHDIPPESSRNRVVGVRPSTASVRPGESVLHRHLLTSTLIEKGIRRIVMLRLNLQPFL